MPCLCAWNDVQKQRVALWVYINTYALYVHRGCARLFTCVIVCAMHACTRVHHVTIMMVMRDGSEWWICSKWILSSKYWTIRNRLKVIEYKFLAILFFILINLHFQFQTQPNTNNQNNSRLKLTIFYSLWNKNIFSSFLISFIWQIIL